MTTGQKDPQHITPDGVLLRELLHGSALRECNHIVTGNGITTVTYTKAWEEVTSDEIRHCLHVRLNAGTTSAWHMHRRQTDHVFCIGGHLKVVLYDDREESPTRGQVDVHHVAGVRPQLLVIPPGVWHGIKVLGAEPGVFINYFDRAYDHADPDEYRLPADTDTIPFRF